MSELNHSLITSTVRPIVVLDGRVQLLDQRRLPTTVEYFDATNLDDMIFAIKDMVVRGAPAIGVAAAIGLAFQAQGLAKTSITRKPFMEGLYEAKQLLQSSRPTAVNIRWATELIYETAVNLVAEPQEVANRLVDLSVQMIEQDIAINKRMGERGQVVIADGARVLTHCNAGALATCGWGTALGIVRSAKAAGKKVTVYAAETRPRQQGARLTTWELLQDGIDTVLIADTMSGYLMSQNKIDLVIVGADRIATNGDAANKIGTYTLAVLASAHGIPFYVAAPLSTIDPQIETGKEIPIEERDAQEVKMINGALICPAEANVVNPAFDVTPSNLITAIITEAGLLKPPFESAIRKVLPTP